MCTVIFQGGINFFIYAFHLVVPLVLPSLEVGTVFSESDICDGCALFFFKVAAHFFPGSFFYLVVRLVLPSLEIGTIFKIRYL